MTSTDLAQINVRPRVNIDGTPMANMGEAALALQIHLPRRGMASAELRLLNWGGIEAAPDFVFQSLRLGSTIEIILGESSDTPSFSGEITALEERYGDGAPQLVILAEDALHHLARGRENRAFEDMSLDDVVSQIANEGGLQSEVQVSQTSDVWLQVNESNLAFLLRQLAPYDVGLRIEDGQLRVKDDEQDSDPLTVDPADNADKIRIIADLNHQPLEVAVNGFNLTTDDVVVATSDSLTPAASGQSATDILGDLGWAGASLHPQPFPRSSDEGQKLAERRLRGKAWRFLHGEIICRNTPQLHAGREIELNGVSPRLSGRYRIVECYHQFDNQHGLVSRLNVQRPDWNV